MATADPMYQSGQCINNGDVSSWLRRQGAGVDLAGDRTRDPARHGDWCPSFTGKFPINSVRNTATMFGQTIGYRSYRVIYHISIEIGYQQFLAFITGQETQSRFELQNLSLKVEEVHGLSDNWRLAIQVLVVTKVLFVFTWASSVQPLSVILSFIGCPGLLPTRSPLWPPGTHW